MDRFWEELWGNYRDRITDPLERPRIYRWIHGLSPLEVHRILLKHPNLREPIQVYWEECLGRGCPGYYASNGVHFNPLIMAYYDKR